VSCDEKGQSHIKGPQTMKWDERIESFRNGMLLPLPLLPSYLFPIVLTSPSTPFLLYPCIPLITFEHAVLQTTYTSHSKNNQKLTLKPLTHLP
jgi:hypothetical protein